MENHDITSTHLKSVRKTMCKNPNTGNLSCNTFKTVVTWAEISVFLSGPITHSKKMFEKKQFLGTQNFRIKVKYSKILVSLAVIHSCCCRMLRGELDMLHLQESIQSKSSHDVNQRINGFSVEIITNCSDLNFLFVIYTARKKKEKSLALCAIICQQTAKKESYTHNY